jgi:hypothetical protein
MITLVSPIPLGELVFRPRSQANAAMLMNLYRKLEQYLRTIPTIGCDIEWKIEIAIKG